MVEEFKGITQSAYARARGVSPQYIGKLVKRGVIVLHAGLVYPDEADRAIVAAQHASFDHLRKTKVSPPPADPAVPLPTNGASHHGGTDEFQGLMDGTVPLSAVKHSEIRKLLDLQRAIKEKIENEKEAGRLLDAEEARRVAFRTHRDVRDGMLNLPSRVAGALAAKALQLFRDQLDPQALTKLEAIVGSEVWQDTVFSLLNHEIHEVLNALSDPVQSPSQS